MNGSFVSHSRLWVLAGLAAIMIFIGSCTNTIATTNQPTKTSPIPTSPTQTSPTQTSITPSNTSVPASPIDKSIVQVWIGERLEASGVVIGDGSQVLTVIDYEIFSPQNVNVITSDGDNFTASIQQLDPRTGATLLAVAGMKLPPVKTGDTTSLVQEQQVNARWYGYTPKIALEMQTAGLLVNPKYGTSPLVFGVYSSPGTLDNFLYIRQGAIITDDQGLVIGLMGVDYNLLFTHPSAPGMHPGVVRIESALELLIPDFAARPYANGPLMIVITNEQATGMRNGYFTNYDAVTEAMQNIFHRLGAPLPSDELPVNAYGIMANYENGDAITVVYARPVQLTSENGTVLAESKWVTINWNRGSGLPNQLFYGSGRMVLEGGFQLPDDLSELLKTIDPLAYHGGTTAP